MLLRPLIAGVAVLVVAGCGGGSDAEPTTTITRSLVARGGQSLLDVRITEDEYFLSPANFRLGLPGVYTLHVINEGRVPHALVIEGAGGRARTKTIQPGAETRLRVDLTTGADYTYYCPLDDHRAKGMEGTIVREA